jgi:lambda family phage portal protein
MPGYLDRGAALLADLAADLGRRYLPRRILDGLRPRVRAYDGASVGRRVNTWLPGGSSATTEILASSEYLRHRSRELARNNPTARRALSILSLYLVGAGIRPRPKTGNKILDTRISALWSAWSRVCRPDSAGNIYTAQSLAVRSWLESGEVLIRRRWRPNDWNLPVPVQLQILEADYLDTTLDQALPGGRRILGGIEMDTYGRRAAYHLWREHPGERIAAVSNAFVSVSVPASEVLHLYQETRPGQVRGVPWLHAVMLPLFDLTGYTDAERTRKKMESCLAAFVEGSNPDEIPSGEEADGIAPATTTDASGNPIEMFEPGMIAYLGPSKTVKFNQPAPSVGTREFVRVSMHEIAAGCDIPYEALTSDLAEVNFSSIKVGRNELRLLAQVLRQQVVIPLLCDPIWRWFSEAAALADPSIPGDIPVEWTEPAIVEVDRETEAKSDELEMRIGTRSRREIVVGKGTDPDRLDEEIREDHEAREASGVVLDSDPAQTAKSGQKQTETVTR